MLVYDPNSNRPIDNATIFLTVEEAKELHDDLASLIARPSENHAHIYSCDYQREVTVCVYDAQKIDSLDEKTRKLLIKQ